MKRFSERKTILYLYTVSIRRKVLWHYGAKMLLQLKSFSKPLQVEN